MPNNIAFAFSNILSNYDPVEFQIICQHYLIDLGYVANLGPIPGRDQKHDIFGQGRAGNFIAHCTTDKDLPKSSVLKEIANGARNSLEYSAPREIYFFSRKRAFPPAKQQEFLECDLFPELASIESRYVDDPPSVLFVDSSTIAQMAAMRGYGITYETLLHHLRSVWASDVGLSSWINDGTFCQETADSAFLDLVRRFDPELPEASREDIICAVLQTAWRTLILKPEVCIKFLRESDLSDSALNSLLRPLVKFGLRASPSPEDVLSALNFLERFCISKDCRDGANFFTAKLWRCIIYERSELLLDGRIEKELDNFASVAKSFQRCFSVDILYRAACNYIELSPVCLSIFERAGERYFERHPKAVLTTLRPLVVDPMAFSRQYPDLREVLKMLLKLAPMAQNPIDSRWLISSAMRIMPLYDSSDEERSYSELLLELVEALPYKAKVESPFVLFTCLHQYLRCFDVRRDVVNLIKYEKTFIRARSWLYHPQITHLQLEYVSVLLNAINGGREKDADGSAFFGVFWSNSPLHLHPLFSNHLTDQKFGTLSKKDAEIWLLGYAALAFKHYAECRVSRNHINALDFVCASHNYHMQSSLSSAIKGAIERVHAKDLEYSAEFYAKSCSVMSIMPRQNHIPEILNFVSHALKASQYSIVRSSRGIGQCLYSAFYYGNEEERAESLRLTTIFEDVGAIGKSNAKSFWIYVGGISYNHSSLERDFVENIWAASSMIQSNIKRLAAFEAQEMSLILPHEILLAVKEFQSKNSLVASAMAVGMNDPEIWNVIGTTIMNNRDSDSDCKALDMASLFYAFAKCFVRGQGNGDQKYCYNLIKCRAQYYKVTAQIPAEEYVVDVALYLTSRRAKNFFHKRENAITYFEVVKFWWSSFSGEARVELRRCFKRLAWARDLIDDSFE